MHYQGFFFCLQSLHCHIYVWTGRHLFVNLVHFIIKMGSVTSTHGIQLLETMLLPDCYLPKNP